MMTPEVSRFAARVIIAGRRAVNLSGSMEAVTDHRVMWGRVTRKIQEVGQRTRTVDDLPQWLLDLADQLGVERPVARQEDIEPLPVMVADRCPWNANWLRPPPRAEQGRRDEHQRTDGTG